MDDSGVEIETARCRVIVKHSTIQLINGNSRSSKYSDREVTSQSALLSGFEWGYCGYEQYCWIAVTSKRGLKKGLFVINCYPTLQKVRCRADELPNFKHV